MISHRQIALIFFIVSALFLLFFLGCISSGTLSANKEIDPDAQGTVDFTYSCNWESNSIKCEGDITNVATDKEISNAFILMVPTNPTETCTLQCQASSTEMKLPPMKSGSTVKYTLHCNLNQRTDAKIKLYFGGGLYIMPPACN